MEKISGYYSKPQKVRMSESYSCKWNYTEIYRNIRGDKEYIYEFIRIDCDCNGYYRLLQIRKIKEVKLTDKEGIRLTSPIHTDEWTIHHPFVDVAVHQGVELIEGSV